MTAFLRSLSLIVLTLSLLLTACASDKDKPLPEKPAEELYNSGVDLLRDKSYQKAAQQFEEVERQHPYSQWATRAQLMAAYAQYLALDYDAAVATLEQFIQLHPGNKDIAYAYYLRALSYYERIADVRRDQSNAQNALKALQDVIGRYPDSVYAKDAVLKVALVNDHLAGAEMEIGRNYQKVHLCTAAVGRFRTVVEKYQTTSHVPEALHRLVECYLTLGITREARATAAVLGYNFPGSTWYEDSYALLTARNLTPEKDKGSWINSVWPF